MLRIVPVGWATSIFLTISYVLWVILGFSISGAAFREVMEWHMVGLTMSSPTTIILGLIWSFLCGWYVSLVFVPIYNAFARS